MTQYKRYYPISIVAALIVMMHLASSVHAQDIVAQALGAPERLNTQQSPDTVINQPHEWQLYSGILNQDNETFWFRQKLQITGEKPLNPLSLSISAAALYDAYWDGQYIGSNSHLLTNAPLKSRIYIPVNLLTTGEHNLHLRLTGQGLSQGENIDLTIVSSALRANFFGVHYSVIIIFFVVIASAVATVFFLIVGLKQKDKVTLLSASLVCFLTGSNLYISSANTLTPYPYIWEPVFDHTLAILSLIFIATLPLYVAARLQLRRPWMYPLGILIILPLSFIEVGNLDHDIRVFLWLSLYLLIICGQAFAKGNPISKPLAFGVCLGIAALLADPDQKYLFAATITILFATELGLELRRRSTENNRLTLMSERLRGDLLRRNIQPHFLMNSLTVLLEWIETSPEDAASFVHNLAEEFRMLLDFSERKSVLMKEELELCNIHLRLMSSRLQASVTLDPLGVDTTLPVPPAIIHTLIENALSHNHYNGENITLTLTQTNCAQSVKYIFSAPIIRATESTSSAGLGTRYITARLEEFYGKAFHFKSEKVGLHWVSTIEAYKHQL